MIQFLIWLSGTYVLLVMQTAICPSIALGPIVPNLFAALLIPCLGINSERMAIVGAAIWGLALDSLGSAPLGINMISFTLVALMVQRTTEHRGMKFSAKKILWMGPLITIILTVEMLATWPLEKLTANWNGAGVLLAGSVVYSFLLGLFWITITGILRRLFRRTGYGESRAGSAKRAVAGW